MHSRFGNFSRDADHEFRCKPRVCAAVEPIAFARRNFIDDAVGKHLFHAGIDSRVKFFAFAKDENARRCARISLALRGSGPAAQKANLDRTNETPLVPRIDRWRPSADRLFAA